MLHFLSLPRKYTNRVIYRKEKSLLQVCCLNVCIISPLVKVIVSYLFPVALIVCLVTTLNEK